MAASARKRHAVGRRPGSCRFIGKKKKVVEMTPDSASGDREGKASAAEGALPGASPGGGGVARLYSSAAGWREKKGARKSAGSSQKWKQLKINIDLAR